MRDADALLVIGSRLGDIETQGYTVLDPAAPGKAIGRAGLRPAATVRAIDLTPVVPAVQAFTIAFDGTLWRSAAKLEAAQERLDELWRDMADHGHARGLGRVALREQAAMLAIAAMGSLMAPARWAPHWAHTLNEGRFW